MARTSGNGSVRIGDDIGAVTQPGLDAFGMRNAVSGSDLVADCLCECLTAGEGSDSENSETLESSHWFPAVKLVSFRNMLIALKLTLNRNGIQSFST